MKKCSSQGCPSNVWLKGLCKAHHRRATGELSGPVKHYVKNKGNMCRLVCDRPAHILGLCKRHYRRMDAGLADWATPLLPRSPNFSLSMGPVRVRRKYAEFYLALAEGMGMSLRALATYLLEEYAQNRLNEQVDDDEPLTRNTAKRR